MKIQNGSRDYGNSLDLEESSASAIKKKEPLGKASSSASPASSSSSTTSPQLTALKHPTGLSDLMASKYAGQGICNLDLQALINNANSNGQFMPKCPLCEKTFANSSNLKHHMNTIHFNEAKWICNECGKVCTSKSNLKVHLRVHLRVKPYYCRWCDYNCMHHSSIKDHLSKCHPEKSHNSCEPGYIFNSAAVPEPDVTHLDTNNSSLANSISLVDSSFKELISKSNKKQQQVQVCHQEVERDYNDDDQMECDKYAADSYETGMRLLDNNCSLSKKLSDAINSQKKKATNKRLKQKQKKQALVTHLNRNKNKYAKKSDEDDEDDDDESNYNHDSVYDNDDQNANDQHLNDDQYDQETDESDLQATNTSEADHDKLKDDTESLVQNLANSFLFSSGNAGANNGGFLGKDNKNILPIISALNSSAAQACKMSLLQQNAELFTAAFLNNNNGSNGNNSSATSGMLASPSLPGASSPNTAMHFNSLATAIMQRLNAAALMQQYGQLNSILGGSFPPASPIMHMEQSGKGKNMSSSSSSTSDDVVKPEKKSIARASLDNSGVNSAALDLSLSIKRKSALNEADCCASEDCDSPGSTASSTLPSSPLSSSSMSESSSLRARLNMNSNRKHLDSEMGKMGKISPSQQSNIKKMNKGISDVINRLNLNLPKFSDEEKLGRTKSKNDQDYQMNDEQAIEGKSMRNSNVKISQLNLNSPRDDENEHFVSSSSSSSSLSPNSNRFDHGPSSSNVANIHSSTPNSCKNSNIGDSNEDYDCKDSLLHRKRIIYEEIDTSENEYSASTKTEIENDTDDTEENEAPQSKKDESISVIKSQLSPLSVSAMEKCKNFYTKINHLNNSQHHHHHIPLLKQQQQQHRHQRHTSESEPDKESKLAGETTAIDCQTSDLNDTKNSLTSETSSSSSSTTSSSTSSYECTFCNISFNEYALYTIHAAMHNSHNPLQCNVCGHICCNKIDFAIHILHLAATNNSNGAKHLTTA